MDVVLDHEKHIYTNVKTGEPYISVTNFISNYKKPFDKDFWSKKIAERQGVAQESVLEAWKKITTTAQDRGTKIHLVMERFLKDNYVEEGFEELTDSFSKKTSALIKNDSVIESERLLYNHDYKVAGTADLIVENGNTFYILDFKTNKAFNFVSKYNDYFYSPIDYLPQCEFTTYTIQMSIYAYMHEILTGKKCGGLKIFYLREFSGRFWQEIPCIYMKDAVKSLFEDKLRKDLKTSNNAKGNIDKV